MRVLSLFYILTTLLVTVTCQPYDGFPFAEQLPPVARVDEIFSFQFASNTYKSDLGEVTYSVSDLPSWLSFDASSRTLSGTPSSDDVSSDVVFALNGTDSSGATFQMDQTLIVSDETGPVPSSEYTVLSQLTDFGQTNGENALVLSPGQVFNVTFDSKTFDSDDQVVAYYGTSADRSPLPNWLFFDASNLRFSGVAPAVNSEIAPGFPYNFIFIATDYAGFTGSSVDFKIIVGAHSFTTTLKSAININGTAGDTINFEIPLSSVYQDFEPVTLDQISRAELQGNPEWLSLNNYTLTGTVPEDFSGDSSFNVTIFDHFSNDVTLFFDIESIDSLFAVNSFRPSNATRDEYFQYYFLSTDFTDFANTNISLDFGQDGDWLTYHSDNLTINGLTPESFDETDITVTARFGSREDELSFMIYGIDPIDQSSSSASSSVSSSASSTSSASSSATSSVSATASSSATPVETSSAIASIQSKSTGTNKKALAIGLGVGLPVFALIVAGILLFCCCYKKRSKEEHDKEQGGTPKISKPMLGNPSNGKHNMISPAAFQDSSSEVSLADDDEGEPKRLGALNVLKLDEKDYFSDAGSSSTTNVEDTISSVYQDALQSQSTDMLMKDHHYDNNHSNMPKKSWRQTVDSNINRESLNSLASVSTNELLSMRLAEDDDIQKDPRKSSLNFRDSAFIGKNSSSILTRDDSGNIQRLDSDGKIVENLKDTRQRASRATNLDILTEEDHGFMPIVHNHENSFTSNSSGGEEFFPVSNKNGEVKWEQQQKNSTDEHFTNMEDSSKAKLKTFTNVGRADTSDSFHNSTYETAEIESV